MFGKYFWPLANTFGTDYRYIFGVQPCFSKNGSTCIIIYRNLFEELVKLVKKVNFYVKPIFPQFRKHCVGEQIESLCFLLILLKSRYIYMLKRPSCALKTTHL